MKNKRNIVALLLAAAIIVTSLGTNLRNVGASSSYILYQEMPNIGDSITVYPDDVCSEGYELFYMEYALSDTSTKIYLSECSASLNVKPFDTVDESFYQDLLAYTSDSNYHFELESWTIKYVGDIVIPYMSDGIIMGNSCYRKYKIYPNFSEAIETATKPESSVPSGKYSSEFSITLSGTEGSDIFYTTDGSEPTINSTKYNEKINVQKTTTIKAAAYEDGKRKSPVAEYKYTISSVDGVKITVDSDNISIGDSIACSVDVSGQGDYLNTVNWSILGNKSADTTISDEGKLFIGIDESASAIVVKATSNEDSSKSGTAVIEINNVFKIDGNSSWESVIDFLKKDKDTANENTLVVSFDNGKTVLPGNVMSTLKDTGKNIKIIVDDSFSWYIQGKNLTDTNVGDINLGITKGTDLISVDLLNEITNEKKTIQVSLVHNGSFGGEIYLDAKIGTEYAGMYANLMYNNPITKTLDYQTAVKIDALGSASIPFNHASEYAIIIGEKDLNPALKTSTETAASTTATTTIEANSTTTTNNAVAAKTGDGTPVFWLFVIPLGALFTLSLTKKKIK